jgi:hypothetical protein
MMLNEYDVVRLKRALPEHGLAAGAVGTILILHRESPPYEDAFEVEFCDDDGGTIALITVHARDLEKDASR